VKVLISHVDLDGVGVAVLESIYRSTLDFYNVRLLDYGWIEDCDWIRDFDEVVIVDHSLAPEDVIEHIIEPNPQLKSLTILDHHHSSEGLDDGLSGYKHVRVVVDGNRSGTKLFLDEIVKPKVETVSKSTAEFADVVDTYDRWVEDSPLWNQAVGQNAVLYGMMERWRDDPFSKFISRTARKLTMRPEKLSWTANEYEIIVAYENRYKEEFTKAEKNLQVRVDSEGIVFILFPASTMVSRIASQLLDTYIQAEYAIVVNTYQGISGKISIRSKRGFDCTQLAVANGHKEAAGGVLTEEQARGLLKFKTWSLSYNNDDNDMILSYMPGGECRGS
jgi:oligoribonuclease NrnB/cAMP/cGMP phosphodiesterase (DHH superfamily)